jgi:phosphatidylglycerophosphatase C
MTRQLVLFDFDGTITSRDTLLEFCRFAVGNFRFALGFIILSPILIFQKLKLLSAQRAKEIFISYFIGSRTNDDFASLCNAFVQQKLRGMLRSGAIEKINEYKKEGARVVVVSASPENWIKPWAIPFGLEVIATKLQINEGIISGKISGNNCNGVEKVVRIKGEINLNQYDVIVAYGDSPGDKPMLQLAHQKFFKPFRDRS